MTSYNLERYTLDLTGVDPNNLVENERRELFGGTFNKTCFVPTYGCFYRQGFKIVDSETGKVLEHGTDYEFIEQLKELTVRTGLEIYTGIIINVTGVLKADVTYQAVGGPYSTPNEAIAKLVMNMQDQNETVYWREIVGKPGRYTPTEHTHILNDVYGFGPVIWMLERIRQAIMLKNNTILLDLLRAVGENAEAIAALQGDVSNIRNELMSILDSGLLSIVNTLKQRVNNLYDRFNNLEATINNIDDRVTVLENTVVNIGTTGDWVTTTVHNNDIANLNTSITNNTNAIDDLRPLITANTTRINQTNVKVNKNTADIEDLRPLIQANTTNINKLGVRVTTNTNDITVLKTKVAKNTLDIEDLRPLIAANTAAHIANANNISTNTANIATNVTNIAKNLQKINLNAHEISINRQMIMTNVNEIARVEGRFQNYVSKAGDVMTGTLAFQGAVATINMNGVFMWKEDVGTRKCLTVNYIQTGDIFLTSDRRKKTDITPITESISTLKKINGYTFTMKDSNQPSAGVIAQELEEVLPDLVGTNQSGDKTVSYTPLIGYLIEGLKEQQQQIDDLTARLAALESK